MSDDETVPRTDLVPMLMETLMWIDLRVKLATRLQEQADTGDERARDQLDFLSKHWPTGGLPRQREISTADSRERWMRAQLVYTIDILYSLNLRCPEVVSELTKMGVELPSHVMEVHRGSE